MSTLPDEFCRLCLRVDGIVSVFSVDCLNSWNLCDRIFECVSVKISEDDVFPQSICNKCLQKVNAWCEFKTTCDRLQRTWYLWLKSVYGSKDTVKKRIRDHARMRSLELGYWKRKDYPGENSIGNNSYRKRPRRLIEDDCIVIDDDEDDDESSLSTEPEDPSNSKKIRIESTHTLSLSKEPVPVENGFVVQNSCIAVFDEETRAENVESGQSTDSEKVNNVVGQPSKDLVHVENVTSRVIKTLKCLAQAVVDKEKSILSEEGSVSSKDPAVVETEDAPIESLEAVVESLEAVVESLDAISKNSSPPPWQPKTLKNIVQAVLDVTRKEKPALEQPNVPSVAEVEVWQPKTLKNYAQHILDALEGKISGPEQGPWQEDYYLLKETALEGPTVNKSATEPRPIRLVPTHELQSVSTENTVQLNVLRSLLTDGNSGNSRNNDDTEADEVPVPSPPDSSQPESSINPSTPVFMDCSNSVSYVNIKEEPMSDDDNQMYQDDDYNYSLYNVSVKTEPPDYPTPMTTISTGEILNSSPSKNRRHFCTICNKRLSNEKCYLRHLNSSLHRMISSAVSAGKQVTAEMRRSWLNKIKADSQAKRLMSKTVAMRKPVKPNRTSTRERVPLRRYSDESATTVPSPSPLKASNNPLVGQDATKFGNKKILSADEIIIRDAPNFALRECSVCNLTFPSRSQKVRHDSSAAHKLAVQQLEASLRPPPPPPVQATSVKQMQRSPMVKAINQPHSAVTYSCPFADCSLSFLDGGQLIVHMHSHGISMPMKEVQDQINRNTNNQDTVKEGTSDKSAKCPRCGACFSHQGLASHLKYCRYEVDDSVDPMYQVDPKLAGADPDLVCHICGKVCKNIRSRQYHIDIWHTSKPSVVHKCTVCPRMFRSKFMLKRHVLSHGIAAKSTHQCRVCKRIFHLPNNLQSHLKKHFQLGKNSFVCPKCLQIFHSQAEYVSHRNSGCPIKVKILSCNQCENSYNSQKSLDDHIAASHPVTFEPQAEDPSESDVICNICNRRYSSIQNLKRHMLLHQPDASSSSRTFTCSMCPMTFPNKVTRDTHDCLGVPHVSEGMVEAILEEPPPPPPVIKRRRSLSVDSDGTLFSCRHCSKPFTLLKSLHSHVKRYCRVRNAKCIFCGHIRNTRKPEALCRRCRKSQFSVLEGDIRKVEKGRDSARKVYAEATSVVPDLEPLEEEPYNNSEKSVENVTFKCPVGNKTFLTERSLNAHIPDCKGTCKDTSVYCKKCRKKYENPFVYLAHKPCKIRKKTKSGNQCHLCPRMYGTSRSLWAHLNKFHRYSARGGFFEDAADEEAADCPRIKVIKKPTKTEPGDEEGMSEEIPIGEEEAPVESISDISQLDYPNQLVEQDNSLLENSPLESAHNAFDLISKDDRNCPSCDISFQTPLGLKRHINSLHRNIFRLVACPFCDRKIYKRELYEHGYQCITSNLPTVGSMECAFCGVLFLQDDDEETISFKLQSHILSCGGKLPFKNGENIDKKNAVMCFKCCHLFAEVGNMRKHMTMRHGERRSKLVEMEENPPSPALSEPMGTSSQIAAELISEVSCASGSSGSESVTKSKAVAKKRTAPPAAVAAEQGNLKCKFCNRSFFSLMKLVNHEKVHGIVQKNVSIEGESFELDVTEISS